MNIAFFTESNFSGKIDRKFAGRTDTSWMCALNANHIPFSHSVTLQKYDLGIIIVPKKNPNIAFDFFDRNRNGCKLWAVMQEGPQDGWQDYDIPDQFRYLKLLNDVNCIFVHNEIDRNYYSGLISHKNAFVLQSLMIDDSIPANIVNVAHARTSSVIGGNLCSWYGGMDSFIVASEFGTEIYAPSMGRKREYEDYIEDITYLPYMNWNEWIVRLSKFRYAVHLMRTYAAGTFALNTSYLGIPCIGYSSLDTQRICQPDLTVDEGDLVTAKKLATRLKVDSGFYKHCSDVAVSNYLDNYSEEIFVRRFSAALQSFNHQERF